MLVASASPYATSLDGADRLLVSDDIRHNNDEIAVPHHLQVLNLSARHTALACANTQTQHL